MGLRGPANGFDANAPPELRRKLAPIVADPGKTDEEVYREYDVTEYCSIYSFQRWAQARRLEARAAQIRELRSAIVGDDRLPADVAALIQQELFSHLAWDDEKDPNRIAKLAEAVAKINQVRMSQAKDVREEGKHEAWTEDRKAKQEAALDRVGKKRSLDAAALAEIRKKVVGL